jgi:dihydrofolate synthase / folylpolyglutamate synthase
LEPIHVRNRFTIGVAAMTRPAFEGPIRTLDQAAHWLESLLNIEKRPELSYARFSLGPIQALLARLDGPDRGLSVLHVAGSKGKGSVALFAEAILRAAGRRTGTFTSPHLERWTERFRIDGREVADDVLAAAVDRVRPHVEALRMQGREHGPTFFDATTAAALLLFREAQVDHVVLEVGLGGRLDSTNAVAPAITCITSIEYEHTDRLGSTLAEIAAEKAGILKAGVPAVIGALPDEALRVVTARATALGAPLVRVGVELVLAHVAASLESTRVRFADADRTLEVQLRALGAHQAVNAALAAACVRRLLKSSMSSAAIDAAVCAGLAAAELPGRVEVISRAPWVMIDAAHTAVSARALAEILQRIARPVDLVLSISAGKDTPAILDALLPCARSVTLTRAEPARSAEPEAIAAAVRARVPGIELRVVPNPHLALRAARDALAPEHVLCVTGSVYLAGIARGVLRVHVPAERIAVTRPRG